MDIGERREAIPTFSFSHWRNFLLNNMEPKTVLSLRHNTQDLQQDLGQLWDLWRKTSCPSHNQIWNQSATVRDSLLCPTWFVTDRFFLSFFLSWVSKTLPITRLSFGTLPRNHHQERKKESKKEISHGGNNTDLLFLAARMMMIALCLCRWYARCGVCLCPCVTTFRRFTSLPTGGGE